MKKFFAILSLFVIFATISFAQDGPRNPCVAKILAHMVLHGPKDFTEGGWEVKFLRINDPRGAQYVATATQLSTKKTVHYFLLEDEGYDKETDSIFYTIRVTTPASEYGWRNVTGD